MKKQNVLLVIIYFSAITFAFSSCQKNATENVNILPSPNISQNKVLSPIPNLDSPIRKIDFKNFIYPWAEFKKTFTLENGKRPYEPHRAMGIDLSEINYADVTGDGEDDAILLISLQTGESRTPNMVYIYSSEKEQPKLLWNFKTDDGAEGGLKKVYAENGGLIVELFGENKLINNKWETNTSQGRYKGLCCPISYTKTKLNWNGNSFVVAGEPEFLVYISENQTDTSN